MVISKVRHSAGGSAARTGGKRVAELPCGGDSMMESLGLWATGCLGVLPVKLARRSVLLLREFPRRLSTSAFLLDFDLLLVLPEALVSVVFFLLAQLSLANNEAAASEARKWRRFKVILR